MKIRNSIILFICLLQITFVATYAMDEGSKRQNSWQLHSLFNADFLNHRKIARLEIENAQMRRFLDQKKLTQNTTTTSLQKPSESITTSAIGQDIAIGVSCGIALIVIKELITPHLPKR